MFEATSTLSYPFSFFPFFPEQFKKMIKEEKKYYDPAFRPVPSTSPPFSSLPFSFFYAIYKAIRKT